MNFVDIKGSFILYNFVVNEFKIENGIVTEMSKDLPLEKVCASAPGLYRMSQKGCEAYFQSTEKIETIKIITKTLKKLYS